MISLIGTTGTISLIILFYVLARLSERFGSVVKMRPLYQYYYLALFLALIGSTTHVMVARSASTPTIPNWVTNPWFVVVAYHLPLAIAVSIALYVTWHYWSWLITDRNE
jgi:hypothetical protein